jgi:glycosyltransferase involved in cell wall biosynthesis
MKVLLLGGYDRSLIQFRAPLIQALVARGHEVVACAPAETPEIPKQIQELGARFRSVAIKRTGLNPFYDLWTLLQLYRICRAERPDVILSYTIKPVIYGSLAARLAGVPGIHAMVTGLGAALSDKSRRDVRFLASWLYRLAFRRCQKVFAQNPDIAEFLLAKCLANERQVVLVKGSGVDLKHYAAMPAHVGRPISFLLLARLLRDKGIYEYVAAARQVRVKFPQARFCLAGATDTTPGGIALKIIQAWHDEGIIHYLPFQKDVRPLLADCDVYVLPSYYLEGIPHSILEAMAVGRPIITTDASGCRETVKLPGDRPHSGRILKGENGFLVPVRKVDSLADAMGLLAASPALVEQMGRRSRAIAEAEFDAVKVSAGMIEAMAL